MRGIRIVFVCLAAVAVVFLAAAVVVSISLGRDPTLVLILGALCLVGLVAIWGLVLRPARRRRGQ